MATEPAKDAVGLPATQISFIGGAGNVSVVERDTGELVLRLSLHNIGVTNWSKDQLRHLVAHLQGRLDVMDDLS